MMLFKQTAACQIYNSYLLSCHLTLCLYGCESVIKSQYFNRISTQKSAVMADVICNFLLSHQACVQTLIHLFTLHSNIKHDTLFLIFYSQAIHDSIIYRIILRATFYTSTPALVKVLYLYLFDLIDN